MSGILIVTNGTSGVDAIRQTIGTDYSIISWDDVLHDGPVPFRNTLAGQSAVRTQFLCSWVTEFGGAGATDVEEKFRKRDAAIGAAIEYEEVVLWFDHDLYDQLQLLQVGWSLADLLAPSSNETAGSRADEDPGSANCASPAVTYVRYRDYLNATDSEKMLAVFNDRIVLSSTDLAHLATQWRAFSSSTPELLALELGKVFEPFGNLQRAMLRLCEEYPSVESGMTRSERQILSALVQNDSLAPGALFAECQAMEEVAYLGDWSFWRIVTRMASASLPLVRRVGGGHFKFPQSAPPDSVFLGQRLSITELGRKVQGGSRTWNRPETWIGGVLLSGTNDWRWDEARHQFVLVSGSTTPAIASDQI